MNNDTQKPDTGVPPPASGYAMTDELRLSICEHLQWDICCFDKRWLVRRAFGRYGEGPTMREAIDAAINATPFDKMEAVITRHNNQMSGRGEGAK